MRIQSEDRDGPHRHPHGKAPRFHLAPFRDLVPGLQRDPLMGGVGFTIIVVLILAIKGFNMSETVPSTLCPGS